MLTISRMRIFSSARLSCQSIWKESPIAAKLARSLSTDTGASAEKWTRMKNRPVSWSPNCWLSSMLQPVMNR